MCYPFLVCILSVTLADSWGYPYNETEWGRVSATCVEGTMQSPVDLIPHSGVEQSGMRVYSGTTTNLVVSNESALTWIANANYLPRLHFDGDKYSLLKIQCHIGSEHTVDGFRYPGSCHFVHQVDSKYAVIALSLNDSAPTTNSAFDLLLSNIELAWGTMISGLDLGYYWEYTGSFTTPNCDENVLWLVLRDGLQVTPAQIEQMKNISGLENNFRDLMPLNGRAVSDGSEIGNITVLWYVTFGWCTEEEALQIGNSVAAVLGLSAEEMVVVHTFELHGDADREAYPTDVWDVEYRLSVVDNTRSFVDRFLENLGVDDFDNDDVTDAILNHFEAETGVAVQRFVSREATVIYSTFEGGDSDHVILVVIVVAVVLILLSFIVTIVLYMRKRKLENQVSIEIAVEDSNEGTSQLTKL